MSALLFLLVILAWGFTWFAIKLQLGTVPPEISICYRFALAAAVLWLGLAATGRLRRVPLSKHPGCMLLGLCLFCVNFLLFYGATQYIASGIVSVVFSTATVFNAGNQWLVLKRRPSPRVLLGAAIGVTGIALLFGPSLMTLRGNGHALLGAGMALAGTFTFSLGNMVSARVTRAGSGLDLPNAVVRAMTWGTIYLAVFALARGRHFTLDLDPVYLASLAYLAIPGSVMAFLAYLSLVGRIGADRAAYATVVFPLVALTVSTLFEHYVWTPGAFAGLVLILGGNVAIFARLPGRRAAQPA